MSTYYEFAETSPQDLTSQDSRVPRRHKPMDIYSEDNEYYEEEGENTTNLEEGDEEEEGDAWDDSALIAAWDTAVKEYQDFHSIKANKKSDTTSKTVPTYSNNEMMETEKSVNTVKEEEIEQEVISSALDENEDPSISSFVMKKTSIKKQKQPEQKIKETRQIKPQTASVLTSGLDTSYQPQPIRTTATYSSYSHHFPGYYSYPPPSATSSTASILPHSYGEQIKGTTDTLEYQEESQLPPTEEATTSSSAHGWYFNYYPPPPPPPGPQPPPKSHSPNPHAEPNFPGWRPKPPDMAPPMPGFDDDAFTNLIMAWYYSGYYTGLYHGRKGR